MPDGRRRSREGWADSMEDGPPHTAAHTHRLPTVVRVAFIGMVGAVFLLLVAVGLMAVYVYQANQYVQGRGEFRDQENQRTNQRINDAICDLLDQLPEGGLLDRPRAKYGCGPGIPVEKLTPQEQAQIARPSGPPEVHAPTPSRPVPPRTGPGPGGPTPGPAAAAPRTAPATPTPTPSPLRPVTDLACDLTGVCPS